MCSHGTTCPPFSDDDTFLPSHIQSRGSTAVSLSAQAHLAGQAVEVEERPCPSSCPADGGHLKAAHIWFHRDATMQTHSLSSQRDSEGL